jgi:hypothetical protein
MSCCFCGATYTWYGNNAQPVVNSQCCDDCNYNIVIPTRMGAIVPYVLHWAYCDDQESDEESEENIRTYLFSILAEGDEDEDEEPNSVLDTPFN